MSLQFAYATDGEVVEVKDFKLASGFSPKKGSVVTLTNGEVAAPAANAATVLGVFEGGNFRGLAGDAVTVTENSQRDPLAKVRIAPTAVYRVPLKSGATAPVVGAKHALTAYDETSTLDTAITPATATTGVGAIYQVIDYDAEAKNCFVVITGRVI